jgi:hypothetical protein
MRGGVSIAAHQHASPSLPGLTRQSMLRSNLQILPVRPDYGGVSMDARVKPAHDEDQNQTNKD